MRKHELEVDVADDVAERDAPEVDVVGRARVHDAVEPPLEPRARRLIELRMKIRKPKQQPDVRCDAPVVDPQPAHRAPRQLRCAEQSDVGLNTGQAKVVVGELVEDTLGG